MDSNHFDVSVTQNGNQLVVTLTNNSGSDQNLNGSPFSVEVTKIDDSDGDDGETLTLAISEGGLPGSNSFINFVVDDGDAPIAIDLDGDGITYLGLDEGVVFTDQATGESVNSAWVGPEDGMLVIDANNSGTVDESREYVFTEWSDTAQTDMEAVAEVFDTNKDGVLDAQDEQWDQFAVWQDADSDGVTDEGELVPLSELGVESISLTYNEDSVSGTAADGDVIVHGQSTVTFTDGSTTIAEDVSFAISAGDVISDDDSVDIPPSSEENQATASQDGSTSDTSADRSGYDADLLEADLMTSNNNADKLDSHEQ